MKIYPGTNTKHSNYYKKPFYKTKGFYILLILIAIISLFIKISISKTNNDENNSPKFSDQNNLPITSAKVIEVSGKLEIKFENENWEESVANYQIQEQSYIRTAENSRAIIQLPDKSFVRLKANSQIKLEQLGLSDIVIDQLAGETYHRVNDQSTAIYKVKNGKTEITALGTAFDVFTSNQLTYLTVIENRTKIKIYDNDTNIINMRTVDTGFKASINPSLDLEKMIQTEEVTSSDLLENDWYAWNLEQDRANDFFLGLFEQAVKLVITEPRKADSKVDAEKIMIKGETDAKADIFVAGKELDNNNGHFEIEYLLGSGENEIEITVIKGKNKNKKILTVTSTKLKSEISLTGKTTDNNVALSWTIKNLENIKEFKILNSTSENPTFPDATYHTVEIDKFEDVWNNLQENTYFFRICAYTNEGKCIYSDNFSTKIGENSSTTNGTINLLTQIDSENNVSLSWSTSPDLKTTDGFKTIISQDINPVYPGNSYHSLAGNARSDSWQKLAPGTYNFRVCLLKNNNCTLYSENKIITIKELAQTGSITLIGQSNNQKIDLSWQSKDLTAPKGFKVIMNSTNNVVFPGESHHLITSADATSDIWTDLTVGQTYYFRVCQTADSGCGVYSNVVKITF